MSEMPSQQPLGRTDVIAIHVTLANHALQPPRGNLHVHVSRSLNIHSGKFVRLRWGRGGGGGKVGGRAGSTFRYIPCVNFRRIDSLGVGPANCVTIA